jgi:hypothetical protein
VALAAKRRVVVNAGRRTKRNKPRRLTPKQIKFFGTPAQKASLKRRRATSRTNSSKKAVRKTVNRARTYQPRKSSARKNPGDILSLVLNPGGRKGKKNMAAKSSKRSRAARRAYLRRMRQTNPARPKHRRRYKAKSNPAPRRRYARRSRKMNHRRRNPGFSGGGFSHDIMQAVAAFGGFFGSKLATQLVMGSGNTGVAGYMGNAAATAALAIIAGVFPPTKKLVTMIVAGGAIQIISRVLSDNTAFGTLTSQLGVGDYQMQNFVTPQRLTDPLNSAAIEIPAGWGAPPAVVVSSNAPPGAMPAHGTSGYNSQGNSKSLYSSQGVYN